jgi:hypothetical protein
MSSFYRAAESIAKRAVFVVVLLIGTSWSATAWGQCDASQCRRASIKESVKYARSMAKALAKCNDGMLKERAGFGPDGASCDDPRNKTQNKIAAAKAKAQAKIDAKCGSCDPQDDLGFPATCPTAACGSIDVEAMDGQTTCALCEAEAAVAQFLAMSFDPPAAEETQHCERAIGKYASKFFSEKAKRLLSCNLSLEKGDETFGPRGASCDSLKTLTQSEVAIAAQKMASKIAKKCCGGDGECVTSADGFALSRVLSASCNIADMGSLTDCVTEAADDLVDGLIDLVSRRNGEPGYCGDGEFDPGDEECDASAGRPLALTCPGVCTQTNGGWGSACSGNNTGCLRDDHFDDVFPGGLVVGDPDGPDADGLYALELTSTSAVEDLLPEGGSPAALTADETDPSSTSSNVFGGQLVAATLNVEFDAAGFRKSGAPGAGVLGTLLYLEDCEVDTDLVGLSVNEVLDLANTAISGGGTPAGVTIDDLNEALSVLNENFVDCDTDEGCLTLPPDGEECLEDCTCPSDEPFCGDNNQDSGEECDGTDAAACPEACRVDCTCPPPLPFCGDTNVDPGEECDPPGNTGQCPAGAVCSQSCECEPVCGDANVDPGEECDPPGNTGQCPAGAVCSQSCECEPVCGDNNQDSGEECDGTDAAACPEACQGDCTCPPPPPLCGDGVVDPGEECDPPGELICPGEPIPCGETEAPQCDGACDPGYKCRRPLGDPVQNSGPCECILAPDGFECGGNDLGPPHCWGSCGGVGETCAEVDGACVCQAAAGSPELPCQEDCTCPAPECGDGVVDPGEECDPPGELSCPGEPIPCGQTEAPQCDGACDPGYKCRRPFDEDPDSGPCLCIAAPEGLECGGRDLGIPHCWGSCGGVGETCAEVEGACVCRATGSPELQCEAECTCPPVP